MLGRPAASNPVPFRAEIVEQLHQGSSFLLQPGDKDVQKGRVLAGRAAAPQISEQRRFLFQAQAQRLREAYRSGDRDIVRPEDLP